MTDLKANSSQANLLILRTWIQLAKHSVEGIFHGYTFSPAWPVPLRCFTHWLPDLLRWPRPRCGTRVPACWISAKTILRKSWYFRWKMYWRKMWPLYWFTLISRKQKCGVWTVSPSQQRTYIVWRWDNCCMHLYSVDSPATKELIRSSYCHDHLHYYGMADHHAYGISQKCHFYCWNKPSTFIEKKIWKPEIRIQISQSIAIVAWFTG